MQRLSFLLLVCAAIVVTSGCATHKFVRNQVKTSSDTLTARIETNEGQIKEVQDEADKKVSGVETKVSELDTKTSEQINSVKTDVQGVDQRGRESREKVVAEQQSKNYVGDVVISGTDTQAELVSLGFTEAYVPADKLEEQVEQLYQRIQLPQSWRSRQRSSGGSSATHRSARA